MLTKSLLAMTLILSAAQWALANGTFSLTRGKVYLTKAGKSEKRTRRGRKVTVGDTIRTEAGSYAKITMSDKNIIHVGPNSKMVFAKYASANGGVEESQLSVLYGKVRTALEKKYDGQTSRFRVTTEAAVLGVRGTDFITEHSQSSQQTKATTLEGIVAVAGIDAEGNLLGEKTLTAGEMTLIQLGSAPLNPVQLPGELLQEVTSASTSSTKKSSLKSSAQAKLNKQFKAEAFERPVNDVLRPNTGLPRELIDRNIISSSSENSGDAVVNVDVVDAT